jgi:putative addiction module killer protein
VAEFDVILYAASDGKIPFQKWLDEIKDQKTKRTILLRIQRIRQGNFGDAKMLANSDGIRELRIDFGPGFRIYFSRVEEKIILLLIGGDKSTQWKDIEKAKVFLEDYKRLKR